MGIIELLKIPFRLGLLATFLASLTAGCLDIQPIAPTDFPYELMLVDDDFPKGWFRAGGRSEQITGAIYSNIVGFGVDKSDESMGISQQLTIYPNEQTAIDAFANWEEREFPSSNWERPEHSSFVPHDPVDLYRMGCAMIVEEYWSCAYLQQHRNLVSAIFVNIDDQLITFNTFEHILKRLGRPSTLWKGINFSQEYLPHYAPRLPTHLHLIRFHKPG